MPNLVGAGGFEPPNAGIKTPCLATWLRPKKGEDSGHKKDQYK